MSKIIIGIHGLANKSPEVTLDEWWKQSLIEGLKITCGIENPEFEYKMVFWANRMYKNLLHMDPAFTFDKLYNDEPYEPAVHGQIKEYKEGLMDDVRAGLLDIAGSTVDSLKEHFGMNSLADWALDKVLKDLSFYYDDKRKIRNRQDQMESARIVLRDELANVLKENSDKEIMLIAHSMGTIIAYDVLRIFGQNGANINVSHFVTIGSPLGLPHVKAKIIDECKHDPVVRTPSIVSKSWVNFADKKDPVALDIRLRDDYGSNSSGVQVVDDLVVNDYLIPNSEGKHNHHKSYGYLRTPELSLHVEQFLNG